MKLESVDALIQHLRTCRTKGYASRRYSVPTNSNGKKKGTNLQKRLRKEFPLDRFIVTEKEHERGLHVLHCHS